ncbi:hypothetical protein GOP47_0008839 [Adiantum capillus-veneris]|uniref:Peptidase C45 hydrolase domain-containing protein n=1 Tax=Adiantum capillus-veneris TaxID=13818 RepID=A0A9D4UZC2_ADICA|nr:hypothetical protein GOP47_0008839 [Adiantum capillus-veneris]
MMQNQEWLPSIRVDASDPYYMGLQIGRRFQHLIKSRISKDPFLHSQLLPFASTHEGQQLIEAFSDSNKRHYPRYWYELQGLADGSCVSLLEVLLLNFRKEVLPFLPSNCTSQVCHGEECSDISVCSSVAVLGHNEDANVSVKGHVFLVHASLPRQASFTAFTLAGELPSCAFGFNTHGVGFTLNAVPLSPQEVVAGGIGRNFISRDLLEATCLESACERIQVKELALGHSYNIFDVGLRRIVNVETASKGRFSVKEIGAEPFFHANMYRHLEVPQVEDQSSIHRHARAAELPKRTKEDFLSVLGDIEDQDYPLYMQGPLLQTLCTVLVDIDARKLTIYKERPCSAECGMPALLFDL